MPYATPSDMLARFDARTIGDLVADDDVRVTPTQLLTNVNLLALLLSASGMIDAALLNGGQYSPADLVGLSSNSTAYLTQITCEITMAYVYARKPGYDMETYRAMMDMANDTLERLRKGQNTLGLQANIDAGSPSIDGPTVVTYNNLNLLRDRVKNYYPERRNPYNR